MIIGFEHPPKAGRVPTLIVIMAISQTGYKQITLCITSYWLKSSCLVKLWRTDSFYNCKVNWTLHAKQLSMTFYGVYFMLK